MKKSTGLRASRRIAFAFFLFLSASCAGRPAPGMAEPDISAYGVLRNAYAARDAQAAAAAYGPTARLAFEAEQPPVVAKGHPGIANAYLALFGDLPSGALDLNFRIETREVTGARIRERGIYRLKVGSAGTGFGRFEVERDIATGLFVSDRSLAGTRDDFERAPGPLLFAQDTEDLDPAFYGRLTGQYVLPDGCRLVATHSVVRVLIRNTCDQNWRGLERVSGTSYTFGQGVRPAEVMGTAEFELPPAGPAQRLILTEDGVSMVAERRDPYLREDVEFFAPDGTRLAGTIRVPTTAPRAATVIVHGSGPQDRNGFASIIAVMADTLATSGHVVLTYDKRGSGKSGGDGERASFGMLAKDAEAARQALAAHPSVAGAPTGFAGSSQAGWVVASALEQGAKADHVILVGAAGAALTVERQNLYNTEALMRCAGRTDSEIDLALQQQRAFFAVLANRSDGSELTRLTAAGRNVPGLTDWLFPDAGEIDRTSADWFNVLELDFDPMPVWRAYSGKLTLILGAHDDSTPTQQVARTWQTVNALRREPATLVVLPNAQHIGLKVDNICQTDFTQISSFAPGFIEALSDAAARAGAAAE